MAQQTFADELSTAVALARDAGRIIMRVYATAFSVEEKGGGEGPVTRADQEANEFIVQELKRAFPRDSVIAEESGRRDENASERLWFVDPLDGTREFVRRNDNFAVHIGLAVAGSPVVGVVYAPVFDKMYAGVVKQSATLTTKGTTTSLAPTSPADLASLRLVVSRSHASPRIREVVRRLGITKVAEHGSVGLKVGLVAEGAADLYLQLGARSSRWDTCAPEAVLRACGGTLTDTSGAAYLYDGKELLNVRGIVAGSVDTVRRVLPTIADVVGA